MTSGRLWCPLLLLAGLDLREGGMESGREVKRGTEGRREGGERGRGRDERERGEGGGSREMKRRREKGREEGGKE